MLLGFLSLVLEKPTDKTDAVTVRFPQRPETKRQLGSAPFALCSFSRVMSYSQEPLGVLDTHCMSSSFSKEQRHMAMVIL